MIVAGEPITIFGLGQAMILAALLAKPVYVFAFFSLPDWFFTRTLGLG